MIEKTLARLDGWIPTSRRLVVTHKDQVPGTEAVVKSKCARILGEPVARNTAPALMVAALEIQKMHLGSTPPVMVSLHADHFIKDEAAFREALLRGIKLAEEGQLTLLGIKPDYPETGYGYIELGTPHPSVSEGFKVASFREKPDRATALNFIETGRFLWNSGLFVWQVSRLLEELRWSLKAPLESMEQLYGKHHRFQDIPEQILQESYGRLPKISIDHAVLETSRKVSVVKADIGWQDIGSWSALEIAFPTDSQGNLIFGQGCFLDSRSTTIDSDGPFVAALGVEDLVIVASGGAILVCPKSRSQEVKEIVTWLEAHQRKDLL
jgi:mannose-1-phosphate guanylyltransferase